MPELTIKQHDTWPPLRATLKANNVAIDLTTATSVRLILQSPAPLTIIGVCSIVSPATSGVVTYSWISSNTATVGTYNGEFEITWANGAIETVPNDNYFQVAIKADLG
jgi:hypothetical protein